MMQFIRKARIGAKISTMAVLLSAAFVLVCVWLMGSYEESLYAEKKAQIRSAVELAHSVVTHYVALTESGDLPEAEAQKRALDDVRDMRFGENGYFWINDMQPKLVMHPFKTDWVGDDLSTMEDLKGKRLYVEFVDIVQAEGEGFSEFYFTKPGEETPLPKIGFVKGVEPWGWIIGSGAYVDDVAAQMAVIRWKIFGAAALAVLLSLAVILTFARRLSRRIGAVSDAMRRIADGDLDPDLEVGASDEVGELAASADAIVRAQQEVVEAARGLQEGRLDVEVAVRSDRDRLTLAMIGLRDTLAELVAEVRAFTEAGHDGNLSHRADPARFRGVFRELVEGTNATLEAVRSPIDAAAVSLDRLARRDLTARMGGSYRGDFLRVQKSLNSATERLENALGAVAGSSEQVASAAAQIGAGSESLAAGASEQAGRLQEVGSGLEEMASMADRNQANTREASALASAARNATVEGVEAMSRLSEAMERIQESTAGTAKIVKTIDEIAFQTNLLALNAAVEAARAGEAGKGFAVVAEEVRALAIRSAEAAKSTSDLIEEATRNAAEGAQFNTRVVEKLEEIDGGANRTAEVLNEITESVEQQAEGVRQITGAVSAMMDMTQATAANAEESAASAQELSGQSDRMRRLVAEFEIGRGESSDPGPQPAPETAPTERPARSGRPERNRVATAV